MVDAACNVLAWNQLAAQFIGDLSSYQDRNMIRWTFRWAQDTFWTDEDFARFTRSMVADLRVAYWSAHEVEARGPMLKHVNHPLAGPLEFECQVLHIADTGQRLIAYCAATGSATAAAFRQLATARSTTRVTDSDPAAVAGHIWCGAGVN